MVLLTLHHMQIHASKISRPTPSKLHASHPARQSSCSAHTEQPGWQGRLHDTQQRYQHQKHLQKHQHQVKTIRYACADDGTSGQAGRALDLPAKMQQLADEYGVTCHLNLGTSPHGCSGLFWGDTQAGPLPAGATAEQLVIRVPLNLVLGDTSVLGAAADPCTERACSSIPKSLPWEARLGALLLWACRPPEQETQAGTSALPHTGAGMSMRSSPGAERCHASSPGSPAASTDRCSRLRTFWSAYCAAFLPRTAHMASLLMYSEAQLIELQDEELMQTALDWQKEVEAAHHLLTHGDTAYNRCCGTVHGLEDLKWSVAAVESRAFGVRVRGELLQAMVPFFDLANHGPQGAAMARHCLTEHPVPDNLGRTLRSNSSNSGDGVNTGQGSCKTVASESALARDVEPQRYPSMDMYGIRPPVKPGHYGDQEFLISYGEKSNQNLMEQYGFVQPGNRYERLEDLMPGTLGMQWTSRVRRDGILAAETRLICRLQDSPGSADGRNICGGEMSASGALGLRSSLVLHAVTCTSRWRASAASLIKAVGCRNMRDFKAMSEEGERQVLIALMDLVLAQLAGMPTSIQEDMDLAAAEMPLASNMMMQADGIRLNAAVSYRMERKICLEMMFQLLEEALKDR